MAQILTYPWGTNYRRSGWENQVKDGKGGSIPCNNTIFRGRTMQDVGSTNWWATDDGEDNAASVAASNEHFEQPLKGGSQKGLAFWKQTSVDNFQLACWFDIGAEGGKEDGTVMSNGARSSWLREVTALWFMFNSHDTTAARGCYSQIEKAGIRYRDPDGRIRIKPVTQKLGEYTMGDSVQKGDKVMFGYAIPSSERSTICSNDWRFLGLRIQIRLVRTGSGNNTDYIQGGVTAIRLGLGDVYNNWNTNNKRALVLRGNKTYTDFTDSDTKDMLETR